MFWVKDTCGERYSRIRSFLTKDDAAIAVLLAAANLEWTLRRAIILLTISARAAVRAKLEQCHGLSSYESTWDDEVLPHHQRRLSAVVKNWEDISRRKGRSRRKGKFQLRHDLIHGSVGSCSVAFARSHVEAFLLAASDVETFCAERGKFIYKKLPSPTRIKEP
jgi:hypothetical protein